MKWWCGAHNEMRLCCAAETASALHHGGTFCWQAQRHDECPGGGSINACARTPRRSLAAIRYAHRTTTSSRQASMTASASDSDDRAPNLDVYLGGEVYAFESELEEYWKGVEDGDRWFAAFNQLADITLRSAGDLSVSPDALGLRKLADSLQEWGLRDEVRALLQIRVYRAYMPTTEEMAKRCFDLSGLVVATATKVQIARFLRRVSRCYICGFEPECAVVCRATLENALNAKYDDTGKPVPVDVKGRQTMRTKLDGAVTHTWMDERTARDAWTVWTRGNKVAHDDPDAIGNAFETIRMTMSVLEALT